MNRGIPEKDCEACQYLSAMREPNFFLVGAPKAGSTSLYYHLRQHPDIYMSPMKEPSYFSFELRPENYAPAFKARALQVVERTQQYLRGPMTEVSPGGMVTDWQDYLRLFAAAGAQHAVGEASVCYMVSHTAAAAIAALYPHAKILMVLRSPADRAFSQYLQVLAEGHVTGSFQQYVRACLRHSGEGLGVHEPFLEMGFYAAQVQRYIDCFPRNRIGIWIYEEHLAQPSELLRQIFRFLEVEENFQPDTSARHHQPRVPKMAGSSRALQWARTSTFSRKVLPGPVRRAVRDVFYRPPGAVTMSAADRTLMHEFYAGDVRKLETILNRDLSGWLV
jgi:hypothetical protein